jgi:DNA polymerase
MNFINYDDFDKNKQLCRDCEVGLVYNKVVSSDGNKVDPTVLIIGEACGSDEVIAGKPFVGKCGKLLRETLATYGFNESNCLITNTLPCRPEKNKFPKDKNLVFNCVEKWLIREIEIVKPKLILLVGSTPTKFLLRQIGITKLRGLWFEFKNIPCMPIYHPSYVQRKMYMKEGPQIKSDFCADIESVAKRAGFIS